MTPLSVATDGWLCNPLGVATNGYICGVIVVSKKPASTSETFGGVGGYKARPATNTAELDAIMQQIIREDEELIAIIVSAIQTGAI